MSFARSTRPGRIGRVDGDGRTVDVRLVAWDTPANVSDDGGRTWYSEQFTRGGLTPGDDRLLVRNEHTGAVVGRVRAIEDRDDGAYAQVRVADTADGRDLLALLDEDVVEHVSIEFDDDPTPGRPGQLITRARAVLTGLAFTLHPAHLSAAVLGRRSLPTEASVPTFDIDGNVNLTPTEPDPDGPDTPEIPDPEPVALARSLPAVRSAAGVHQLHPAAGPAPVRVGRFRSLGEFVRAAASRQLSLDERAHYFRALSSAASSDAPGLFAQEAWIGEIIDLRRNRTPSSTLFSQRPLPPTGNTINQPVIIQRPLVGLQDGELAQIPSRKVKIGSASWDVDTYAGGQGMSIQLIERSDPSYLNEVYRMYVTEMDLNLEVVVAAAVLAASDDTHPAQEVNATGQAHVDAFIDAAALLLKAPTIQSPPEVLGMSVDMWVLLAKAKDTTGRPLFPALGPMNAHGQMSLTNTDTGQVMDLAYAIIPSWTGKVAVMGVRDAFRTMVGPMNTMQADVPETLSRDYAVYEFAAHGPVDTAGLVKIVDAA